MPKLYEAVQRVEQIIAKKNLPLFRTKGLIALEAGFALGSIDATTPDDPAKLEALRRAARQVLGEPVY